MITLISSDETHIAATDIVMKIDDENATLTNVLAQFVDFTRMIGYQSGSWLSIIDEVFDVTDDTYSIFDWATDKMIDSYME